MFLENGREIGLEKKGETMVLGARYGYIYGSHVCLSCSPIIQALNDHCDSFPYPFLVKIQQLQVKDRAVVLNRMLFQQMCGTSCVFIWEREDYIVMTAQLHCMSCNTWFSASSLVTSCDKEQHFGQVYGCQVCPADCRRFHFRQHYSLGIVHV